MLSMTCYEIQVPLLHWLHPEIALAVPRRSKATPDTSGQSTRTTLPCCLVIKFDMLTTGVKPGSIAAIICGVRYMDLSIEPPQRSKQVEQNANEGETCDNGPEKSPQRLGDLQRPKPRTNPMRRRMSLPHDRPPIRKPFSPTTASTYWVHRKKAFPACSMVTTILSTMLRRLTRGSRRPIGAWIHCWPWCTGR